MKALSKETNMSWHRLSFVCPMCRVQPKILALHCNADSHILLDLLCEICGKNLTMTYSLIESDYADSLDFKAT